MLTEILDSCWKICLSFVSYAQEIFMLNHEMSMRALQCTNEPGNGMYGAGSSNWTYILTVMIVLRVPPKDVAVEGNNSKGLPCKPALEMSQSELGDQTYSLELASLCMYPRGMFLGRSWTRCPYYLSQLHTPPPNRLPRAPGTRKKSQLYSSEFLKGRLANLLTGLILASLSSFENISIAQTKKNKNLCTHVLFVVCFIKMKKKKLD